MHFTIILSATHEGHDALGLETSGILDTSNDVSFMNSPLINDIALVVHQRNKWLEYGNEIGEIKPGNRKAVERLYDKILALSKQMQKDDMIEREVEREIISLIKSEFGISDLKNSIMDQMGILVSESRNRLISRFNILSAFAVPFMLVATVFQMGVIKFEEVIVLSGNAAVIGWIVIFLMICFFIYKLSERDD